MPPEFLSLDDVLTIHRDQVERYGGSHGVRDQHLLDSAVALPAAVAVPVAVGPSSSSSSPPPQAARASARIAMAVGRIRRMAAAFSEQRL